MATTQLPVPHVTTASQPDSLVERREAQRHQFHLPMVLFTRHAPEPTLYSTTEDISYYGFSSLLKWDLSRGAVVDFLIATPLGEVQGEARVARAEIRRLASRPFCNCYLEFVRFEDGGRKAMDALLSPLNHARLEPLLVPQNKRKTVSIAKPLLWFVLLLVPMCILTLGVFRFIYRDEFMLRAITTGALDLTPEVTAQLEDIYQRTMQKGYPSTDRLVLLMGALTKANKAEEVDHVTLALAPRDRNNIDLQVALAQSLDDTDSHEAAEKTYQRLLTLLDKGKISQARRKDIMLAAARNRVHANKFTQAGDYYRDLLADYPDDMALRNEYAGVLLSADECPAAIKLYEGIEPDLEGRLLLVSIHAQMKDYDAAERECRKIVALRPNDTQAEMLLADVLSWKKGDYSQARAIYERLSKIHTNDPALRQRLAQIALWGKRYDEALARFQAIIEDSADPADALKNPAILNGFVDAASSAEPLTDVTKKLARIVYDYALANAASDPVILSRLAWVMQKLKDPEAGSVLLDRAIAINPDNPAVRKQMFGLLMQANRIDDALGLLQGKELDREERLTLIGMYLKNDNFAAAAKECRAMLEQQPDDQELQRRLADILSWKKDYAESLQLFEKMIKNKPNDPELLGRQAQVTLWSGAMDEAIRRYEALLKTNFEQPEFWPGYIDAVAGGKMVLTEEQKLLTLKIYEKALAKKPEGDKTPQVSLASLAWALKRLEDKKRTDAVLQRAMETPPKTPKERKELAGVLGALGKYADASRLYEGIELQPEDRLELAKLNMAAKDFAAAAKQCQAYLQEKPNDKDARRLMADILSWQKDYVGSLRLFDQLIEQNPSDMSLQARRAEVTVWSGAYDKALQLVLPLLDAKIDRPELWGAYIDAASGIKELTPETGRFAVPIYEAIKPRLTKQLDFNGLSLARLAWVLWKLDRKSASTALLEQLRSVNVNQISDGEQLVDVMAAAGKFADAIPIIEKMIKENPEKPELRIRLAETLLWSGRYDESLKNFQTLLTANFDQPTLWTGFIDAAASANPVTAEQAAIAERIAATLKNLDLKQAMFATRIAWVIYRGGSKEKAAALLDRVVALNPQDVPTREYLASVLGSVGRFAAALAIMEPLAKDDPKNAERTLRIAEFTLGNRDYDKAIVQYEQMLDSNFDQPKLWKGYIDAAAKATKLTEKQSNLAVKIAEHVPPGDDKDNVEMLTRMTWVLARTGEQDLAGEVLDRVISSNPRDLETQKQLADMLTAAGNFQAALPIYEEIVKDHPEHTEFLLPLANLTLWCRKYDLALQRFEPLLEKDFNQPKVWASFIDAAASANEVTPKQIKLALRMADEPTIEKTDDVAVLSRLAWVLLRGEEEKKANQLLDRAISLKPDSQAIRRELAGVLTAADRFDDAVRIYQILVKELPQDSELAYLIADALLGKGDYRDAMNRFESMLNAKFDQPEVWRGYISAAAKAKELTGQQKKMVERILAEVKQRGSKDSQLLTRLAWVLLRDEKDTDTAVKFLDQAVALQPKKGNIRKELAGVLSAAGQNKSAIAMYQGVKMKRDDRLRLANVYAANKEYDKAEKEVRTAVDADPKDEEALMLLADVLSWGKKYSESKRIYRRLLVAHPGDKELEIKIARVSLWSNDFDTAMEEFYRLLRKDREQPLLWKDMIDAAAGVKELDTKYQAVLMYIYDHRSEMETNKDAEFLARLAWVLRRLKQGTKAIELLQQALAIDSNSRPVRLQYAEALNDAGRGQEAEQQFNLLLRGGTGGGRGRR